MSYTMKKKSLVKIISPCVFSFYEYNYIRYADGKREKSIIIYANGVSSTHRAALCLQREKELNPSHSISLSLSLVKIWELQKEEAAISFPGKYDVCSMKAILTVPLRAIRHYASLVRPT